MIPYWVLFLVWAAGAVQFARRDSIDRLLFGTLIAFTLLFIGLRNEVGGDWFNYLAMKQDMYFMSLPQAARYTDPGYALLNWLPNKFDIGIWLTNLVCAALFMIGVGRLAGTQPNPALAVLVAIPYFVIVVAMGYTRQAAAIGIICYALADASDRRIWRLLLMIAVAATFHKSAVLVLPIVLIPVFRKNLFVGIVGCVLFIAMFSVLLAASSDKLITNYVNSAMQSQGANIRVAMNVIAAALLFLLRDRFRFTEFMRVYWTANGVLAIVSMFGLAAGIGSTAIDRLALFLIPLQMIVFSQLPYVLSQNRKVVPSVFFGVIAYSFLVQFVWLNFADNSIAWVPYSTVIF